MIQRNKIRKDSGFSLLELMAVMSISTIVFLTAAVVLSMWGIRYQQLSKIAELQDEAYDCIQQIKHGMAIAEDDGIDYQMIGVVNASSMAFDGNSVSVYTSSGQYVNGYSGLSFKPPKNHSTLSQNDVAKIYLRNGYVMFDAMIYGINQVQSSNVAIFPDVVRNANKDIKVESLVFAPVESNYNPQDLKIVRVLLKASIKLTDSNKDWYRAYPDPYSVEYETFIAIERRNE